MSVELQPDLTWASLNRVIRGFFRTNFRRLTAQNRVFLVGVGVCSVIPILYELLARSWWQEEEYRSQLVEKLSIERGLFLPHVCPFFDNFIELF